MNRLRPFLARSPSVSRRYFAPPPIAFSFCTWLRRKPSCSSPTRTAPKSGPSCNRARSITIPRGLRRVIGSSFTSERAGSADLYRIHPDGTGLDRLTDDPAYDDQAGILPRWQADRLRHDARLGNRESVDPRRRISQRKTSDVGPRR